MASSYSCSKSARSIWMPVENRLCVFGHLITRTPMAATPNRGYIIACPHRRPYARSLPSMTTEDNGQNAGRDDRRRQPCHAWRLGESRDRTQLRASTVSDKGDENDRTLHRRGRSGRRKPRRLRERVSHTSQPRIGRCRRQAYCWRLRQCRLISWHSAETDTSSFNSTAWTRCKSGGRDQPAPS
jgi:hypothetical protein